ncbi:hypothetical protein PENPOL_c005G06611 [Penicillium polonicum]|uniref:Uncharacterized protein n=1 Tax=Penicillium polonicum TaxID=60169 RepID=A0A1V6NMY1_PENPO|nr:hypothetical protein PENPOL_c005G06611 [Penicillium polonicum]
MFNFLNSPIITALLSALIGSLVLYYLQTKLSERVINNFQASETWIPENELVLLTGGSGGIGKQIMEDLSRKKVRVVILDINQPTFELPENVTFYQTDTVISEISFRPKHCFSILRPHFHDISAQFLLNSQS